jgi:hypothetical protein
MSSVPTAAQRVPSARGCLRARWLSRQSLGRSIVSRRAIVDEITRLTNDPAFADEHWGRLFAGAEQAR